MNDATDLEKLGQRARDRIVRVHRWMTPAGVLVDYKGERYAVRLALVWVTDEEKGFEVVRRMLPRGTCALAKGVQDTAFPDLFLVDDLLTEAGAYSVRGTLMSSGAAEWV